MEHLIGKEVQIYPGDGNKKRGIIVEIIPGAGILFDITYYSSGDGQYVVGKQYFISFSANLSFREI